MFHRRPFVERDREAPQRSKELAIQNWGGRSPFTSEKTGDAELEGARVAELDKTGDAELEAARLPI